MSEAYVVRTSSSSSTLSVPILSLSCRTTELFADAFNCTAAFIALLLRDLGRALSQLLISSSSADLHNPVSPATPKPLAERGPFPICRQNFNEGPRRLDRRILQPRRSFHS